MYLSRDRRTRWLIVASAMVVLVTAGVVGFAAPWSQASGVGGGTYTLSVAKSGLCMDLTGASSYPGALIQQWGCGAGQSDQQWTLVDQGSGKFTIKSVASGLCLDVPNASAANDVQLQQWGCGSGQANQLWTTKPARGGTFQIINSGNGLCATDLKASTAPGAAVVQETCTANTDKFWSLRPIGSSATTSATASPTAAGKTITVAADGSGNVTTVQAAIDEVPANNTEPVTIAIKPGTYRGVVTVPSDKPHITLEGLGTTSSAVVIVQNHGASTLQPNGTPYGTFGSSTAFIDAPDFSASNLTFSNDYVYAASPSQAIAVSLSGDRATFTNVRLLGHQDTLFVNNSARAYFLKSYVAGTVDFIFGGGTAVFDQSEIYQLGGSGGVITAASTPAASAYGFLFYKSNITGAGTDRTGSLGRPWGQSAQVLYLQSTLGSSVNSSQPWTDMSTSTWQKARFDEYENSGVGATVNSNRPQLTAAQAANYTPAKYLAGTDGWNPMTAASTATATASATAGATATTASGPVCQPTSYGAKTDGTTKDTVYIQDAINACAGKGTVELTTGKYLSGALTLAGNMTLQLDAGATLLASQSTADYPTKSATLPPLLNASGVKNLTITGAGTIDGQGAPWWAEIESEHAAGKTLSPRPGLVNIQSASNVTISGISLKNAPNVHITLNQVTGAVVTGITISAPSTAPNTDGIDVWSSSNVAITNSTIDDGDDNLAIDSSSQGGAAHDISLSNCTILHGHGLSIGSYTAGGVYNIDIHDDTLNGTTSGIRIKTARGRGGAVHAITYRNLTMTNVANPILITAYYPAIPADGDPAQAITSTTPHYYDITIANVTATGASQAGEIIGLPEQPITGLTLSSVKISANTGLTVRNATIATTSTTITPTSGPAHILQSKAVLN